MIDTKLPLNVGGYSRTVTPGIEFPAWFIQSIKEIDRNLHFVWHAYDSLTENPINEYAGRLDDPRFTIHEQFGQVVFGYLPTNRFGEPLPKNEWHIWWKREGMGWFHVMPIFSLSEPYLKLVADRLHTQAKAMDRAKARHYVRDLLQAEADEVLRVKIKKDADNFKDQNKSNKRLIQTAMENLSRGKILPTNPSKQSIISYPGQKNRGGLIVPVSEREGGLSGD